MRRAAINLLDRAISVLDRRISTKQEAAAPATIMRFPGKQKKSFGAANTDRLSGTWPTTPLDINEEIKRSILPLRARGRWLVKNNVYARKLLHMIGTNVVGAKGVKFQSKVRTTAGKLDRAANRKIEAAWQDWGKKKNCSTCGSLSWIQIQHIFMKTVARDGECLLRKIKNTRFKYGFALQFIDANFLDESYNEVLANGNCIIMGREFNIWGECVNYFIRKKVKGMPSYMTYDREPVPANEIIYGFRPEQPGQARDVTWFAVGANTVKDVEGYKEAAIITARIGASKMGFLFTPTGEDYKGDEAEDKDDGEEGGKTGNVISDVEPGHIEQLPHGYQFKEFNPHSPSGDLEPFLRTNIQGLASGWNVSYISLSNDQKGVSYSTDRSSKDEERDNWKVIQEWLVETLCEDVFENWLIMAITTQALPLPMSKFDKFNSPRFQPKRWRYIDPAKDEKANGQAIKNETTSRTRIAAEKGDDIEDIFDELAWEEEEIAKRRRKIRGNGNATDDPSKDN